MGNLKSGIIFETGIYVPDHNNHRMMLKENGIDDNEEKHIAGNFVKFELIPKNEDPFTNVKDWEFIVEKDNLPNWFLKNSKKYEKIAREYVSNWADSHIFVGINGLKITQGEGYYLNDCINVIISGNSIVEDVFGNCVINDMKDFSTINNILSSSLVNNMHHSSVIYNAWNGSKINYMWNNSKINSVFNGSIVKNMYGNSKIKNLWEYATIDAMFDNSIIENMREGSVVNKMYDFSIVENMESESMIHEMRDCSILRIKKTNDGIKNDMTYKEHVKMYENSIIVDERTNTIFNSGNLNLCTLKH